MMMTNLALTREAGEGEVEAKPLQDKGAEVKEAGEREHMFDKVVTPSDVGKLNRLVIPKNYAERYFPLHSSSNEKGLFLNFEDLTGKSWRFRYSYWNSSQSYVMTKGWSHFVRDKKLDAGDIISFQRCVGDSRSDSRLFIDWRRRPKVPDHPTSIAHFATGVMYPRFYSFPTTTSQCYNLYNHQPPYHHNGYSYSQIPREIGYEYFARSVDQRNIAAVADPLVIESVPVMMHGGERFHQCGAAGKRLRLFGVDMECSENGITNIVVEESSCSGGSFPRGASSSSSSSLFQLRLGSSSEDDHFSKKGKSSFSFDLDL